MFSSHPDRSLDRGWCNLILNQILGPISGLSDIVLSLLQERKKRQTWPLGSLFVFTWSTTLFLHS